MPSSIEIENENKLLIESRLINRQKAVQKIIEKSDFIKITTTDQFNELLNQPKAVLYIQIDWSGVERIGRIKIIDTLSDEEFNSLPKYLIDNSNQEFQFFNDFLRSKNKGIRRLANYGSGEIILFKKGNIIDYIERGFLINSKILFYIFKRWKTDNK